MGKKRIAIIGGGASGLAAAITAARQGALVTILEHKDRVGKKILATGNGRCNYTNHVMHGGCFYAGDAKAGVSPLVDGLLQRYPTQRILDFFAEIGVVPYQRDGYYYPASGQAAAVLDCLREECDRLGVSICCNTQVLSVTPKKVSKVELTKRSEAEKRKSYAMESSQGEGPVSYQIRIRQEDGRENTKSYDRVILCCGGLASPVTGSDGSGYELARSLGHTMSPTFPALTGLKADPKRFKPLAGIRTRVLATLEVDGRALRQEFGELQLTENGLSGIVMFQLSHPAIESYLEKKATRIHIDFMPDNTVEEVASLLENRRHMLGHKALQEWGVGWFPKKLWLQLIKEAGLPATMLANDLNKSCLTKLLAVITDFTVPVAGYLGYDRAQVTAGGIRLQEVDPTTMESRNAPGIYFAGEMLDVDGICGGYNLHFAWATGMAAAEAACRE